MWVMVGLRGHAAVGVGMTRVWHFAGLFYN